MTSSGNTEGQLGATTPHTDERFEPFALTDVQEAYWIGRQVRAQGNVACHLYLELEREGLDLPRLERALQAVVRRHDMLRAIVRPDGRQVVLPEVPDYEIEVEDLSGLSPSERDARLTATRERLSAQVLPSDVWPLWEMRASRLTKARTRIHWSMDLLMMDSGSMALMMGEWAKLYEDPSAELPTLTTCFRDYVSEVERRKRALAASQPNDAARSVEPVLPSPELPVVAPLESLDRLVFKRRTGQVDAVSWGLLVDRIRRRGVTPSAFLCAVFAEVLRAWSRHPAFSLNATSAFRWPVHPQVHDILGDFTSTFLLQMDGHGKTFIERVKRVQALLLEHAVRHRHADSGVRIVKQLSRREGLVATALMPVVFTSNLGRGGFAPSNFRFLGDIVHGVSQTPQVYLDVIVMEDDDKTLCFHWDGVDDIFSPGVPDSMFTTYVDLLQQLVRDEGLFDAERVIPPGRVLAPPPAIESASDRLLHAGFVARATEAPERRAIWTPTRTLTYGQVHDLACRVASVLVARGAGPERLVAVTMHKGWEQVVACLGISMAGAAYVPVDPDLPPKRLADVLADAEVDLVLTQPDLDGHLSWPQGLERIIVSDATLAAAAPYRAPCPATPSSLAYVIYTSGSTGRPKGVMIEHRAASNTIDDVNARFGIGPRDAVFALSSLSFDLSVYDLFGSLAAGATIAMPSAAGIKDPAHWTTCLQEAGVTIWNSVPTLMDLLLGPTDGPAPGARLRTILLSGDWIPLRLAHRLLAAFPAAQVTSLGGATEASIWSILYPIERIHNAWASIPYGRAMRSQGVYVMDGDLELRPDHVPGALYIDGVGLARGYWRDPRKTHESFVTHPRTGQRLYRTGDWGRYLEDGTIVFLGREDTQVKVHGHRIECGEIEAVLARCPDVTAAVVGVREGREREQRLVSFVVGAQGAAAIRPADVRAYLRELLPDYMIPSAIVVIPALPLTGNGKVDHQALQHHFDAAGGDTDLVAVADDATPMDPMDARQQAIASIVAAALGREVGLHVNLFEVGADSLHAIMILRSIQTTFGVNIPLDRLAKIPSVAAIAHEVEEANRHGRA